MGLPANANIIVVQGYWLDELTGVGVKQTSGLPATILFEPVPLLGANVTKTPNLRDIASNAYLKTRTRVATVDPDSGYFAAQLVASNDPDLEAYGGRRVTLLGEDPFVIEVPYSALSTTVDATMAAKTGLAQGSSVRAIWLTEAAIVGGPAPQPTSSYLTSSQTLATIASGVETALASVPEVARDAVGAALVAGSGITVTVNDNADTITITATGATYTDEQAQDAFAALVAAGTHSGISFTYNDAGNAISATVSAQAWTQITGKPTFATVATSGSYADLTSKPTIPSSFTQSTTKTANYTAAGNEIVVVDTSGGTFTVTGPTGGGPFGLRWKAGTIAPTIAAPSGYTISGAATVTPGLAPSSSSGELVLWQAFSADYQPIGGLKPQSALNAANDGRYLQQSGGVLTGDVTAPHFVTSSGFTLPSLGPRFRLPSYRQASTIQNFQSGHPFTTAGSTGVASSNLNDTSTYVRGSQSVSVTTAGTGTQARVRATGLSAMDLTGKAIRLLFKVDDVTHLNFINFYIGTSGLANNFQWTVHTHSSTATNYVQSGEWVSVVLPWADVATASGTYTTTGGTPSTKTGFTDMQFALYDDAAGAVTYHLQTIEFINDTSDTFPNGVISVTFDDSYQTVWDNARPRMDSYGYRGTLYTIADAIGAGGSLTLPELQTMQGLSGWDVAGHAYSSTNHNQTNGFASLTSAAVNDEFRNLKLWMVKNGFNGDTFAYPKGHFDKTTDNVMIDQIASQYWSASRTIVSELKEHMSPTLPQRVRALSAINDGSGLGGFPVSSLIASNGPLDKVKNGSGWLILCFHDVPLTTPTVSSQCSQAGFNSVMDAIQSRGIPVLPVSEVLRYYS